MGGIQITIGQNLWLPWLRIGVDRKRAAEAARTQLMRCEPDEAASHPAVVDEMHASMVGIAAAAFAIDALYGEVRDLVPIPRESRERWKANGTPRPSVIFETFKVGCKLGYRTNAWPPRLEALFDLRDPAAHHELKHRESVPHPSGRPFNVSREFGDYSLESLRSSLDLAFDVVLTVMRQPKAPEMQTWAARIAHVPAEVEVLRLAAPDLTFDA